LLGLDPQRQTERGDRPDPRDRGEPPAQRMSPVLPHRPGVDHPPPHFESLGLAADSVYVFRLIAVVAAAARLRFGA
jgi:hypothetical protein